MTDFPFKLQLNTFKHSTYNNNRRIKNIYCVMFQCAVIVLFYLQHSLNQQLAIVLHHPGQRRHVRAVT